MKPKTVVDPKGRCNVLLRMSEYLGVPNQTLVNWSNLPGFPKKTKTGWLVSEVAAFVDEKNQAENPEWDYEKVRHKRAQASREELRLAQERGELIPAAEVEREWSARINRLKSEIDRAFARAAPQLSGCDAPDILKSLRKLARDVYEQESKI